MSTYPLRFAHILLIAALCMLPLAPVVAASPVQVPKPVAAKAAPVLDSEVRGALHYNTNLVPDGDAEVPYATYWHDNEGFTQIVPYGAGCSNNCTFPSPYDNGPLQRGQYFFYLGTTTNHVNGNNMWLNDRISLSPIQAAIDSGKVRYILSGYFGGDSAKIDTAQLHMFFEVDGSPNTGEVIVGGGTPAQRQNRTGLIYREQTGYVPKGTQNINLALQSGQMSGSDYRTGYADNLSLVLLPIRTFLPLTTLPLGLPPQTGPAAPTGVIAFPNGLTRMDIYWTDNSNNELGYEVQRINGDSSVDTVCNTGPNVTYCLDPGLTKGSGTGYKYLGSQQTYTYQVRINGQSKNSDWASGTGTTAKMPTSAPTANRSFTCQAIGTSSSATSFAWNDPFNYEAGFNLYVNGNPNPSYSNLEQANTIAFINQTGPYPETISLKIVPFVFDPNTFAVHESSTTCTASATLPSPPASGITRFLNDAFYKVISLSVDGWEQFPVGPMGIVPGAYYEAGGISPGQHTWTAVTGSWDEWGNRHSMYRYSGTYTQPASGSFDIHIPDKTINDLLSVPSDNLGYWEGYYFGSDNACHSVAFKFKPDGSYNFYNANVQIDTGTYSLIAKQPNINSVKFRVTDLGGSVDGLLVETQGAFFMNNGPAAWPQVTYIYKPQGYFPNPFCP
jgi:hypothetical protein